MNREIIFRGKSYFKDQWWYGYYVYSNYIDKHFIVQEANEDAKGFVSFAHFTEVDPKTIGQYIGIKDRNGKDIFEGDVVENGLSGTWIVLPLENGSMSLLGVCKQYKDSNYDISALNQNVEIIGNIYENPELTK